MTNGKDKSDSKPSTPSPTPCAHDHALGHSHSHASHGNHHDHGHGHDIGHDHAHDHSHGHGGHHHVTAAELSSDVHRRRVLIVLALTAIYMIVEFIGGKISNSLALWSDATHLLTDVGALSLTFLSFKMGQLPASSRHTFGLRRAEILGAFVNGLLLTLIAVFLIYQALLRIHSPESIDTGSMFIVAAVGLLVNLVSGGILIRGSHDNLAVRGALLHIMGDALGSLGAMVAAGLIWKWGWTLADPIVSLGVAVLILISSLSFIRDTAHIILQGSPRDLQAEAVEKAILEIPATVAVHSLHIWSLTPGQVILSAHVVTKTSSARDSLGKIQDLLKNRFGVSHTTIQIEEEEDDLTCASIDSGTHLPNA